MGITVGAALKKVAAAILTEPKVLKNAPSAASSTYNIWYMSGSTYQTCINLYSAFSGNLNAYFKLKAPALGAISLTKTTEDGKNLSGWRFGIYSDSACTSLVAAHDHCVLCIVFLYLPFQIDSQQCK